MHHYRTVNEVKENFEIENNRKNKDCDLDQIFASINYRFYGAADCNILRIKPFCKLLFASFSYDIKMGEGDIALSFSGCGFLGVYHFGVLQELNRDGKALMKRVKRCAGASAGSLAAALWTFLPDDAEVI
ncbi:unnamed protein product [Onchocerca flexuosa]|uniref:PNPLA domain-containing protein n=1 Tax=Onchocerca flexuosa TaxID=387005 RepID=A0A183HFS0_9BILA|nr:unnamed protein product [Onchocerca flexuosa]